MSPIPISIPSFGTKMAGDFYLPLGKAPHPVVVMAHGFGGIRRAGLPAFALRFRNAGFAVVLFDYRHFGESGGEPRQLLSIRRQIQDWHAAVRFTCDRPEVDSSRIALWGTSYSGGHVVRVAAEDDRVAAVVSQVPFASGVQTALKLPFLSAVKMVGAGLADLVRSGLGGEPFRVPLVGPPGSASAMALHEAVEGYHRLHEGTDSDNRVCARTAFGTLAYRPLSYAGRVRSPLLVQVGRDDRLTPPGPAVAMARRAPKGELHSYPIGHFDIYFGEWFEAAVSEQLRFLRRHLSPRHFDR